MWFIGGQARALTTGPVQRPAPLSQEQLRREHPQLEGVQQIAKGLGLDAHITGKRILEGENDIQGRGAP
jgi:hypothetical protein